MYQIKTFGEPLKPFKTAKELAALDEEVNTFIREQKVEKVVAITDTATTEDGSTIGLIRTLLYKV